jgi:hypothetical protein
MSDDPVIRNLKKQEADLKERQRLAQQRFNLRAQVYALQEKLRSYGGTAEATLADLAGLIAEFMQALRAVGWETHLAAFKTEGVPVREAALSVYRRCGEGDIAGAVAILESVKGMNLRSWSAVLELVKIDLPKEIVAAADPEPVSPFDAYLAELRCIDTPQALLEQCQQLRQKLEPSSENRATTTYEAPATLRELWAAMRRVGGIVPRAPALLKLDPKDSALFAAAVTNRIEEMIHPEDVLQALDDVAGWCIERGARQAEGDKQPAQRSQRGRKPEYDPKKDRRIWDAWQSGAHKDYKALADALGLKRAEVAKAIDREEKRQAKARE